MNKNTSVAMGDRRSCSGEVFDMDGAPVSNDVVVVGMCELCGLGPDVDSLDLHSRG